MLTCIFEEGQQTSLRHVVIDVLVLKGSQLLLVKRASPLLEAGQWGTIGGFVDRDETLKEAVVREVMEETGYEISSPTLLTIRDNPDRPKEDRQNVSFVFFCTAGDKTGEADWESTERKWFELDQLPPEEEFAFDHHKNVELYQRYLQEKFTLPVLI